MVRGNVDVYAFLNLKNIDKLIQSILFIEISVLSKC